MPRATREETGLAVAAAWSRRGTCPRRQVGCMLVDANNDTLATGYNGPASGRPHCIDEPCPGAHHRAGEGLDECEAIHAEANALLRCKDIHAIDTAYCTDSPCVHCVKLLLGTGCKRIVFFRKYPHEAAELLWKAAGREWVQISVNR